MLTLTALLGWMPIALCLLTIDFAIAHGARQWSDLTFDAVFIGLYLGLVGLGALVYSFLDL